MTAQAKCRHPVDLEIYLDVTGSMKWCRDEIKEQIREFADDLANQNLDWRIALCAFRDLKKNQPPQFFDFTTNPRELQAVVRKQETYGGGGNGGESSIDALFAGLSRYTFRDTALRCFLLFTDEPPHDPDESGRSMASLCDILKSNRVITYVVSRPIQPFLALADSYGGLHFDIDRSRRDFRRILFGVSASMSASVADSRALGDAARAAMSGSKYDTPTRLMPSHRW